MLTVDLFFNGQSESGIRHTNPILILWMETNKTKHSDKPFFLIALTGNLQKLPSWKKSYPTSWSYWSLVVGSWQSSDIIYIRLFCIGILVSLSLTDRKVINPSTWGDITSHSNSTYQCQKGNIFLIINRSDRIIHPQGLIKNN